jgi:hypothetical protein
LETVCSFERMIPATLYPRVFGKAVDDVEMMGRNISSRVKG